MKAVLDTNVLVSGIFFGGVPRAILDAWTDGHFELVLTPAIFDEYLRTCAHLQETHRTLAYQELLTIIIGHGTLVPDSSPSPSIIADPDDDNSLLSARDHGSH